MGRNMILRSDFFVGFGCYNSQIDLIRVMLALSLYDLCGVFPGLLGHCISVTYIVSVRFRETQKLAQTT